jgi:hypothetical protein
MTSTAARPAAAAAAIVRTRRVAGGICFTRDSWG